MVVAIHHGKILCTLKSHHGKKSPFVVGHWLSKSIKSMEDTTSIIHWLDMDFPNRSARNSFTIHPPILSALGARHPSGVVLCPVALNIFWRRWLLQAQGSSKTPMAPSSPSVVEVRDSSVNYCWQYYYTRISRNLLEYASSQGDFQDRVTGKRCHGQALS